MHRARRGGGHCPPCGRSPRGDFLCRQKVTKELPRGDAACRAPARQSRSPLGTPLGRTWGRVYFVSVVEMVREVLCETVRYWRCRVALSVWLVPRHPALPGGEPLYRIPIPSGTLWCGDNGPAVHALAARTAGRAVPNGVTMTDQLAHAEEAAPCRRHRAGPRGVTIYAALCTQWQRHLAAGKKLFTENT